MCKEYIGFKKKPEIGAKIRLQRSDEKEKGQWSVKQKDVERVKDFNAILYVLCYICNSSGEVYFIANRKIYPKIYNKINEF